MTTLILNLSILNEEMNGYLKSIDIYIYIRREERRRTYGKGEKTESIVNLDRCLLEREKNLIMR